MSSVHRNKSYSSTRPNGNVNSVAPSPWMAWTIGIFLSLIIVAPNALRDLKLVLLLAMIAPCIRGLISLPSEAKTVLMLGTGVSLLYMIIGAGNAEIKAMINVFAVYVVAPWFWFGFSQYLLSAYSQRALIDFVVRVSWIAGLSVVAYYVTFFLGGISALEFLIVNPWVTVSDGGVVEARLHVSGSLIFLIPAVFAVASVPARGGSSLIALVVLLVSVAVATGRSSVLIAVGIGFLALAFGSQERRSISGIVVLVVICALVGIISQFAMDVSGVNVINVITGLSEKIGQFGGIERTEQSRILWSASLDSYMLGAGHGVGVDYVRSEDNPWRYEMMVFATLFRVGVLGLLIYSLPFFLTLARFGKKFVAKRNRGAENIVFFGFVSASLAAFTNPYLESIEFQWMLFFPYIYFLHLQENPLRSTSATRRSPVRRL